MKKSVSFVMFALALTQTVHAESWMNSQRQLKREGCSHVSWVLSTLKNARMSSTQKLSIVRYQFQYSEKAIQLNLAHSLVPTVIVRQGLQDVNAAISNKSISPSERVEKLNVLYASAAEYLNCSR